MTTARDIIMDRLYAMSSSAPSPRPVAAMRDCLRCALPFFSRSAGNVVCLPCRERAVNFEVNLK